MTLNMNIVEVILQIIISQTLIMITVKISCLVLCFVVHLPLDCFKEWWRMWNAIEDAMQ